MIDLAALHHAILSGATVPLSFAMDRQNVRLHLRACRALPAGDHELAYRVEGEELWCHLELSYDPAQNLLRWQPRLTALRHVSNRIHRVRLMDLHLPHPADTPAAMLHGISGGFIDNPQLETPKRSTL